MFELFTIIQSFSLQATFGVKYKDVAPVHAPRGPNILGRHFSLSSSALDKAGNPEPRLVKMIALRQQERPTYDTYTYKWCAPPYYGQGGATVYENE